MAVLLILLVHAAVLVWLSKVHPFRLVTREDNSPLTLWFLPLAPEAGLPGQAPSSAQYEHRAVASHRKPLPLPAPSLPPVSGRARESLTPAIPESHAASTAIDWHGQASQAAAATLRARERTERQAHALDHPPGMDEGHGIGVIPFRWNSWRAHRLEVLPGALLFHINERCVVAIIPFPMPACALGKIGIHGDLFEHMKDQVTQPPPALP